MKTYDMKNLRELYRVDNKYWKTGDTDLLEKRMALGEKIDPKYWDVINDITSIVTRKYLPVATLVEVLRLLGYEPEEEEVGA